MNNRYEVYVPHNGKMVAMMTSPVYSVAKAYALTCCNGTKIYEVHHDYWEIGILESDARLVYTVDWGC